jgi:hypothetical protein
MPETVIGPAIHPFPLVDLNQWLRLYQVSWFDFYRRLLGSPTPHERSAMSGAAPVLAP